MCRVQLRMVRDEMSFFVKRHELADGSSYVGGYERGKANGQGRRTWPNGDIYEGNFKDGVMRRLLTRFGRVTVKSTVGRIGTMLGIPVGP